MIMVLKMMMHNIFVHHFAFPVQVAVVPSISWGRPHIIILLNKANSYWEMEEEEKHVAAGTLIGGSSPL